MQTSQSSLSILEKLESFATQKVHVKIDQFVVSFHKHDKNWSSYANNPQPIAQTIYHDPVIQNLTSC